MNIEQEKMIVESLPSLYPLQKHEEDAINVVLDALPHWIPVTERLPEKCNTTYLATIDYGKYGRAVGQRFFFSDIIGWNDKDVLAWMPLPEPYKGVTE